MYHDQILGANRKNEVVKASLPPMCSSLGVSADTGSTREYHVGLTDHFGCLMWPTFLSLAASSTRTPGAAMAALLYTYVLPPLDMIQCFGSVGGKVGTIDD